MSQKEISQLVRIFPQWPYAVLNGLLDKRADMLAAGIGDVSMYNTSILDLTKKLAEPHRLLKEIGGGEKRALSRIFERVAETGLVDARPVFEAAMVFASKKRDLADAEHVLDNAIAAMTPKVK